MTPKSKNAAQFHQTLDQFEGELKQMYLDDRLPVGWHHLETETIDPKKTRVTLRLDADMVRWFRKLGPRYQTRINKVLRMYYLGIISGEISIEEKVEEDRQKLAAYRAEMREKLGR